MVIRRPAQGVDEWGEGEDNKGEWVGVVTEGNGEMGRGVLCLCSSQMPISEGVIPKINISR